jgi:hypothetical protein
LVKLFVIWAAEAMLTATVPLIAYLAMLLNFILAVTKGQKSCGAINSRSAHTTAGPFLL